MLIIKIDDKYCYNVMQINNNKPVLSQSNIRPNSHSHENKIMRTLCTIDPSHIEHKDKKYQSKMNKSKSKINNVFNNKRLMTIEYDCTIQPKLNNLIKKSSMKRKGNSPSKKQVLHKNNTLKNFY